MKFELSKSFIGVEDIPSLIIAASDIVNFNYSGKDEKKVQKIDEDYRSFHLMIEMYTAYCGRKMFMPGAAFHKFCSAIDKDGEIVINCVESGENPKFCCRLISHGRETYLDFKLMPIGR